MLCNAKSRPCCAKQSQSIANGPKGNVVVVVGTKPIVAACVFVPSAVRMHASFKIGPLCRARTLPVDHIAVCAQRRFIYRDETHKQLTERCVLCCCVSTTLTTTQPRQHRLICSRMCMRSVDACGRCEHTAHCTQHKTLRSTEHHSHQSGRKVAHRTHSGQRIDDVAVVRRSSLSTTMREHSTLAIEVEPISVGSADSFRNGTLIADPRPISVRLKILFSVLAN